MYLRTTTRTNRDGSEVTYFQLAHNTRHPETRRSVATVIHNFGRADALDRDVLVRLCHSIARVCDLEVRDRASDDERPVGDVLAEGVSQKLTRPLGTAWVIEQLWERLGVGSVLREIESESGCAAPYERALLAMTANRLCEPTSKLGIWDRWLDRIHLPDCWGLELQHMYHAMDLLHAHADRVEEAVFFQTANLLNLEVDLVFYDTTTCSFAIDDADEDEGDTTGLRKLGHSKEGTWTPQVVIALAVTRQGIPVRSWVLPGNTADVTTVERVRKDLRGWKLGRALFVADSGFNSTENREELARACGRYVLACRAGSVAEIKKEVLGKAGRYREVSDNLHVKEVIVGEGELRRRYIVCRNPDQAVRQETHREKVLEELAEALASHRDLDARAKWAAQLRASGRYGRYLTVTRDGKLKIDRTAVREAARHDGKWVLITNDDTLSVEDAAQAYKGLLVIERCFRSLKTTQIRMRPMFHWKERRIVAHVKICVLALLIQRVVESTCGDSWPWLRTKLEQLQATEYHTKTHRFFRRNDTPTDVQEVLKSLDISAPSVALGIAPLPPEP